MANIISVALAAAVATRGRDYAYECAITQPELHLVQSWSGIKKT